MLPVIQKRIAITGASLRRRPVWEKGALAIAIEKRVWPWISSGALRPQIAWVLPLQQAAEAHRHLKEGSVIGKVVLVTGALQAAATTSL